MSGLQIAASYNSGWRRQGLIRSATSSYRFLVFVCVALVAVSVFALPTGVVTDFLTVQDSLQHCDLIYVLGGDYEVRAPAAAKLYRDGWAPLVVMTREPGHPGHNFTDVTRQLLSDGGVPNDAVLELRPDGLATNTADEARALRKLLEAKPASRILVVTSEIHCRRVRMMFGRILHGMNVAIILRAAEQLHPAADREVKRELVKYLYHTLTFWGWTGWQ